MNIDVRLRGDDELRRRLSDPGLAELVLRPGLRDAALMVQAQAQRKVHIITSKLQRSLGYVIEGHGWSLLARIGPRPGFDQPQRGRSRATGKRPQINRGDPREYGWWEEHGNRWRPAHPFLVPALTDNIYRIRAVMAAALQRALARF